MLAELVPALGFSQCLPIPRYLCLKRTLSGLNCLVSCHQLGEGGIALASYNRCLFYMWIFKFLICNPASKDLPEIPNINQQFFFLSVVLFLFNGRSVLYCCSQPLEGDIDASTSLACILYLNVTVDLINLSGFSVFK